MGNIVLLDELTINQIAAGEVIERPASVIKEMVENSIDAGATNITVEIKNGGISYIRVTDNGKGIAADDLEIAFERHATSKIRSAEDLNTVTSMGFRGEALASISAIANVEMVSKTREQEIGNKIIVEAGNVLEKQEIGCQTGTSITVRNLFFNTPVRYKFLKKDYTESGYVEDAITRIALVHPEISIKLINTGKTVIQTNGNGDLKSVIYSIYGKDIANGILEVSYKYEDIQIDGVIGKPEISRSNRSNQLFFVNKRFIKDKTLSSATEQAYKGLIPLGKFGFVVLNIKINPSKVDVNVHPAKLEVRFEEESKVFQAIYHAIKDTLLKRDMFSFRKQNDKQIEKYTDDESKIKTNVNNPIEDIYRNKQTNTITSNNIYGKPIDTSDILTQLKQMKEKIENEIKDGKDELKEDSTEYKLEKTDNNAELKEEQKEKNENEYSNNVIQNIDNQNNRINNETEKKVEEIQYEKPVENVQKVIETIDNKEVKEEFNEIKQKMQDLNEDKTKEISEDFNEMYAKLFGSKPIEEKEEKKEENNAIDLIKNNVSIFSQSKELSKPAYKFIGIVFQTYIILEIENEMYILDQHAAHERIMYEKVKENYYSDTNKDSQMLLLPDVITLTSKEMDIAKDNLKMFEQAGFTLEEFGENTIKLTGVPTVCLELDNKELFLETLDEINTVARTAKQEKEEKFIATVACKAAVKANMALTTQEVEALMEKLLKLPNPFTCPHGRPTAIKMTKYDIERKFARK